jgi:hypothetical protein
MTNLSSYKDVFESVSRRRTDLKKILETSSPPKKKAWRVKPDMTAMARRSSVLEIARQVPGTGLTIRTRQSEHQAQLLDQVVAVAPMLKRMSRAMVGSMQSGGVLFPTVRAVHVPDPSCTTSSQAVPVGDEVTPSAAPQSGWLRTELELLHEKLQDLSDSMTALSSEVAFVKGTLLYQQHDNTIGAL